MPEDAGSLLDALRDHLGLRSAKDGCSPQGQCGCCTVWVDGAPRVACVTPVSRVAGREITTLEGLPEPMRDEWTNAFTATGASQCGFCTPGIIMRVASLAASDLGNETVVGRGAARPPLPVHGVAHDLRGLRARRQRRDPREPVSSARRQPGRDRGRRTPTRRRGRRRGRRRIRRRHRARRRAGRGSELLGVGCGADRRGGARGIAARRRAGGRRSRSGGRSRCPTASGR